MRMCIALVVGRRRSRVRTCHGVIIAHVALATDAKPCQREVWDRVALDGPRDEDGGGAVRGGRRWWGA
eukprot:scaffold122643_cov33-Tisochrysis_lutea.AAC.2